MINHRDCCIKKYNHSAEDQIFQMDGFCQEQTFYYGIGKKDAEIEKTTIPFNARKRTIQESKKRCQQIIHKDRVSVRCPGIQSVHNYPDPAVIIRREVNRRDFRQHKTERQITKEY